MWITDKQIKCLNLVAKFVGKKYKSEGGGWCCGVGGLRGGCCSGWWCLNKSWGNTLIYVKYDTRDISDELTIHPLLIKKSFTIF